MLLQRGHLLRRGVSLEVILEEDDNAEVTHDPLPPSQRYQDQDSPGWSSPSSSVDKDEREEESKRRKRRGRGSEGENEGESEGERERAERWRNLQRHRSLSCETLTVLDIGEDEFSRADWEAEVRDWDADDEGPDGSVLDQIQHCISRRKILAARTTEEEEEEEEEEKEKEEEDQYDGSGEEEDEERAEEEEEENQENLPLLNREGFFERDTRRRKKRRSAEGGKRKKGEEEGKEEEEEGRKEDLKDRERDSDSGNREDLDDDLANYDYVQPLRVDDGGKARATYVDSMDEFENHAYEDVPTTATKNKPPFNDNKNTKNDDTKNNDTKNNNTKNDNDTNNNNNNKAPTVLEPGRSDLWLHDCFSAEEDSWITVGDLVSSDATAGTPEGTPTPPTTTTEPESIVSFTNEEDQDPKTREKEDQTAEKEDEDTKTREKEDQTAEKEDEDTKTQEKEDEQENKEEEEEGKPKQKEVRFSDKVEIVAGTEEAEEAEDHLLSVRTGRELFEERKPRERSLSPLPGLALRDPHVRVVERPLAPQHRHSQLSQASPPFPCPPKGVTKPLAYNVHNTELHPDELPPPDTVASVRQVFEQEHTLHPFYKLMSRFDHVRSNPSSKILRFDRDRQRKPPSPLPLRGLSPSTKPTPLPRGGGTPPPPSSASTGGVPLRKPRVASGFDVRKALRENPRHFHITMGQKEKGGKGGPGGAPLARRNTVTYSYLEAKTHHHRGATTTLRWTKETVDHVISSDADSVSSSDSSEDSGVSRDFSSTILASFSRSNKNNNNKNAKNKNNSKWTGPPSSHLMRGTYPEGHRGDPSFKWIEPSVLSRIRSMGTTVIYFGPRHRPKGAPHPRGTPRHHEPSLALRDRGTQGQMADRTNSANEERTRAKKQDNNVDKATTNRRSDSPRIVGMTPKRGGSGSPFDSSILLKNIAPLKPFRHRDSTLLLHNREAKRKSTGENSVVYNFTQQKNINELTQY